jgi:hypothetical protein
MKTVYSNKNEVCHLWANQVQDHAIAGNVSFNGDSIFSYGHWIMAKVFPEKNTVLIRNWHYSNTTAKHMNAVRRAIPAYFTVIEVKNPEYWFSDNVANLIADINIQAGKVMKSRSVVQSEYSQYCRLITNLENFCNLYEKPIPEYEKLNIQQVNIKIEYAKEKEREREAKREKLIAELQQEADRLNGNTFDEIQSIEEWRKTGKFTGTQYQVMDYGRKPELHCGSFSPSYPVLRIDEKYIRTSRQASITVEEGQHLWAKIKRADQILGSKLSGYSVVGFNGELVVGCHHIPRKELRNFLLYYNWATLEEVDAILPI